MVNFRQYKWPCHFNGCIKKFLLGQAKISGLTASLRISFRIVRATVPTELCRVLLVSVSECQIEKLKVTSHQQLADFKGPPSSNGFTSSFLDCPDTYLSIPLYRFRVLFIGMIWISIFQQLSVNYCFIKFIIHCRIRILKGLW